MRDQLLEIINNTKYENVISLGWFCGMASALRIEGLRSFSSPFDWLFSDLPSVLKMIETDFSEYLVRENMVVDEGNTLRFTDTKYGFYFKHEIKQDIDTDWPHIIKKYDRRIANFIEATKKKTIFFRAVRNCDELAYIESHYDYIESVIKKNNKQNSIVYFLINNMEFSSGFKGTSFKLNLDDYYFRSFVHTLYRDDTVHRFCQSLMADTVISRNKLMLPKLLNYREIAAACIYFLENEQKWLLDFLKQFFDSFQGVYLWGAGEYGTVLMKELKKMDVPMIGVIDSYVKAQNTDFYGIPFVSIDDLEESYPIVISVADDNAAAQIKRQIRHSGKRNEIITFDDFREKIIQSFSV